MLPFPLDLGGKIITAQTIKLLNEHFEVQYVYISEKRPSKSELEILKKNFPQSHVIIIEKNSSYSNIFLKLISRFTVLDVFFQSEFFYDRYTTKKIREKILKILNSDNFDIIHADHLGMAQYFPEQKRQRWIVHEHNVEFKLRFNFSLTDALPINKRIIYLCEAARLFFFEKKMFRLCDKIVSISSSDAAYISKYANKQIIVLPPYSSQKKRKMLERTPSTFVFVGNLSWLPNYDATLWLTQDIFPLIKKEIPTAKLIIIGEISPKLRLTKDKSIVYTGKIPSIDKYLNKSSVFVSPIRIGSGVRLKILTALEHSIPIVSTKLGVKGLPMRPEVNYLLADTCTDFARACINLSKDERLQKKLSINNKNYLAKFHNRERISRKFYEEYIR